MGSAQCYRYGEVENSFYVLRDCIQAKEFWGYLIQPQFKHIFFSINLIEWLDYNLSRKDYRIKGLSWPLVWGFTIWPLWTWRNKSIFSNEFDYPVVTTNIILHKAREANIAFSAFQSNNVAYSKLTFDVQWEYPPNG